MNIFTKTRAKNDEDNDNYNDDDDNDDEDESTLVAVFLVDRSHLTTIFKLSSCGVVMEASMVVKVLNGNLNNSSSNKVQILRQQRQR